MYFLSTFLSVAVLLALLIPGFILRKMRLISNHVAKDLSGILIYIGLPAMIFYCMMTVDISLVTPFKLGMSIAFALLTHAVGFVITRLVYMKDRAGGKKAAASFCAVFANCGFVGIPISQIAVRYCDAMDMAVDAALSEAMLYVTLFNVVFNLLNWTLGVWLYTGENSGHEHSEGENAEGGEAAVEHEKRPGALVMVRKALLNPCTIATVIALPFTLTGVSLLDPIFVGSFEIDQVADFITYLYNLCVPVSMCILGVRIADMKVAPMFKSKYSYISTAIKQVIVPALILGLMLVVEVWADLGMPFVLSMTVMAATPAATTALAFAERFGGDSTVAGECIMFGTVVSAVTVPLFLTIASAAVA